METNPSQPFMILVAFVSGGQFSLWNRF